jgi:hypothetical protein
MSRILMTAGVLLAAAIPLHAEAPRPQAPAAPPAPRVAPTAAPDGLKIGGVLLTLGASQDEVKKALGEGYLLKPIEGTPSLFVFAKGKESGPALGSLELRGGTLTAITRERPADAAEIAAAFKEIADEGRTQCTLEAEAPPTLKISRVRCGRRELSIVLVSQASGEKAIVTEMVR